MYEPPKNLIQAITEACLQKQLTISTAESCTGGLLATWFTEFSGSSAFYLGGVSVYSNASKTSFLGVKETDLKEFGAVSPQVAQQMADGIQTKCQANFGLAVTGIAGPSGGSKEKPVGLVYIGLCYHHQDEHRVLSKRLSLAGDRHTVRYNAATEVLLWLKEMLHEI